MVGLARCRRGTRGPRGSRGFTLIEVLLVILVIAVLAAIIVPRLVGAGRLAKEAALREDLRRIRTAIALYRAHTGVCPAALADLAAGSAPATGVADDGSSVAIGPQEWQGPYLRNPDGSMVADPVTGHVDWNYATAPPHVGAAHSSASGTTMDGIPYSGL